MKKNIRVLVAAMSLSSAFPAFATDYVIKPEVINVPGYETEEVVVASLNVLDYFPDANLGQRDVTDNLQEMINFLASDDANGSAGFETRSQRKHGGVLYLPEGKYKVKKLEVRCGVTIRGDWTKPEPGKPIKGTILMSTGYGRGNTVESSSMIVMEPSAMVSNLSIWYPDQDAADPVPYPPAILYGMQGYWGNDYCNTRNVTLVNPYIGVQFSEKNGGGCPNINGLYGTPLYKGVVMDNIADVGRFDHIDFNPAYWAGSGLSGAGDASCWIYDNGTGFEMRRNDWSYTCNYSATGYRYGFRAKKSPDSMAGQSTGSPNGHNYNLTFTDCHTGVYVTESAGCGIMFTRVATPGCEYGLRYGGGQAGPGQYLACDFSGSKYAVQSDKEASSAIQLQQCNLTGKTQINGGELLADNCIFNGDVIIGPLARTIFTANKVSGKLDNKSIYKCSVNGAARAVADVPVYNSDMMDVRTTKPAKSDLFVVDEEGCDMTVDLASRPDCSKAVQAALDKAKANGGGIVYLNPGHYVMKGEIIIPAGVELRGASDLASVPRGQGTIFEVYCGKGNVGAAPFITMERASGIRGISINYPEQNSSNTISGSRLKPLAYPYAIRANADCYVVNVGARACYQGLDLFTNKCDRHYVDYLSGHYFKNVVRVGGDSDHGNISNIQCNTIVYAAGSEWKFGKWPNSPSNGGAAYQQNYDELDFFVIGDCTNQDLYNNFLFGSRYGMHFVNDGKGGATFNSLGNAVDGVVDTFFFEALRADVTLTNTQLVALDNGHSAHFMRTGAGMDKRINMLNTNNWGGGKYFAEILGGTVNFTLANLEQSGAIQTWTVSGDNSYFEMANGYVQNCKLDGASGKKVSVRSTVMDATSKSSVYKQYVSNLTKSWVRVSDTGFLNRAVWRPFAFNDGSDIGSRRAIDDDASTRWDSGAFQAAYGSGKAPQYMGVYFSNGDYAKEKVNLVIVDTSSSPADGPAGWMLQVRDDSGGSTGFPASGSSKAYSGDATGKKWRTVAEDVNSAGAMLTIAFDEVETTGIRLVQTGNKPSNYWSVHELYVAKLDIAGIEDVVMDGADHHLVYAGKQLIISRALLGDNGADVEVYALNGMKTVGKHTAEAVVDLGALEKGIYIVRVRGKLTAAIKIAVR